MSEKKRITTLALVAMLEEHIKQTKNKSDKQKELTKLYRKIAQVDKPDWGYYTNDKA